MLQARIPTPATCTAAPGDPSMLLLHSAAAHQLTLHHRHGHRLLLLQDGDMAGRMLRCRAFKRWMAAGAQVQGSWHHAFQTTC